MRVPGNDPLSSEITPEALYLHRLAYVAPILAVIHFTWRVKRDMSEPIAYAVVLGALLVVRLGAAMRREEAR
jgi:methionine sulfoxide reductase heme-binding subunit